MFVDSHAHIYQEYFTDIEEILKSAREADVHYIINNGVDQKSNDEILTLVNQYENMYGALGIHPESVHSYTEQDLEFIEENLKNTKIIAIGEIGLDYHYEKESRQAQIKLLERQLAMAEKYHLPVIIHARDANKDVITSLKKYQVIGLIHSFSGTLEEAREYLNLGFFLGINGVITFKNSVIKDVFKQIPLTRIVLETDSPYLAPHPLRGQKNEPKNIKIIAEFVANLKDVSLEELAQITRENIKRVFNF